jgi:hypothetical protein
MLIFFGEEKHGRIFKDLYVIGGLGGFEGADGVNPIILKSLLEMLTDNGWNLITSINRSTRLGI